MDIKCTKIDHTRLILRYRKGVFHLRVAENNPCLYHGYQLSGTPFFVSSKTTVLTEDFPIWHSL